MLNGAERSEESLSFFRKSARFFASLLMTYLSCLHA
jgi:hypothetical protein